MTKILCILSICVNPCNYYSNKGIERMGQYINGLNKFFEYLEILKTFNVDVYIFDNSIDENEKLPQELLDIIPNGIKILNANLTVYGCINKGTGLLVSWLYLQNIIDKYDFLIHFEPRQLLLNFNFIKYFLENQENLFTYGNCEKNCFNTGLFCIRCPILINYIKNVDIINMIENCISIEYYIYNYFIQAKIPYNIKDKMELIWYDTFENSERQM